MNKRELRMLLGGVIRQLIENNFQEKKARPLVFARQRGPFLDLVCIATGRSGQTIDWTADTWTPAVESESTSFDTEIDLNYLGIVAGGHVSSRRVGETAFWSIEDYDRSTETARAMEHTLLSVVMPWFREIVDGESYCNACKQANGGWWRTVRQARRDFIKASIDSAVAGTIEVKPFKFV